MSDTVGYTVELHAKVNDEWVTISRLENSGSQNTGRLRRVADNSVVPTRIVELHNGSRNGHDTGATSECNRPEVDE